MDAREIIEQEQQKALAYIGELTLAWIKAEKAVRDAVEDYNASWR